MKNLIFLIILFILSFAVYVVNQYFDVIKIDFAQLGVAFAALAGPITYIGHKLNEISSENRRLENSRDQNTTTALLNTGSLHDDKKDSTQTSSASESFNDDDGQKVYG